MNKSLRTGIAASIGMLILILDGRTALDGARLGLELCFKTVVPALFPFFILSILLTSALHGIQIPLLQPIGQFFRIPKGAESILISAFLGGYPVGAQSIGSAYAHGYLQREDAQRILAFCNNAGPAFLFGMITFLFPYKWMPWALWGIHILSAFLVSLLFPAPITHVSQIPHKEITISDAMIASVKVMAQVCGWVILFRVILSFLNRWILWLFPVWLQVALIGFLELSNGCFALHTVQSIPLRFILCSCMLSFGGICVTMQTLSVTNGLSLKTYLIGKLLQTLFSFILAFSILQNLFLVPIGLIFLIFPFGMRKNSGNPKSIGV